MEKAMSAYTEYQESLELFKVVSRLENALQLIATPMRPDGTWNRDREACRQLAQDALDGK
jgi:hypothetical protein